MKSVLTALSLIAALSLLGGPPPAQASSAQPGTSKAAKPAAKLVDINSASHAELKTLPGIGDAEAERIVAARPYPSKAKLAADKVLTLEAYAALKGRIVAGQKTQPKSKVKTGSEGKASAPPAAKS